jgi:phosphate transport system substrate-binding protein
MRAATRRLVFYRLLPTAMLLTSCNDYYKNDYRDNSPTSGKLKVYYDEGLALHVKNQAYTFQSQYQQAKLELFEVSENEAVEALYNDSCEAIVISRLLTGREKKTFESKQFFPKYSAVAKSGVALITNSATPLSALSVSEVKRLLAGDNVFKDTLGNELKLNGLLDRNNSAVVHYLVDSLLGGQKPAAHCSVLKSSIESINYVAEHKNTVAFIDFAWLSDVDDSISRANAGRIKFLGLKNDDAKAAELPSQSSFKLGTYPFTRTVYVMRKTGEFSLAKGFESFVAGPKGQLTFLKQGLLPNRQAERVIEVKMEPLGEQK